MRSTLCLTAALLLSCDPEAHPGSAGSPVRPGEVVVPAHDEEHEDEPSDPLYWSSEPFDPVHVIDCAEHKDTGYVKGDPYEITVVTVDGKPVEVQTANAYYQMATAAAKDGVSIKVVSGFRTMAEQQYLYNCYINCNCNNCNLAAKPGYSNHQSGHALDLNTSAAGVNAWLKAHGAAYGFSATVPSEAWHWEWWGGGPPASGPCGVPEWKATYMAQSFPPASEPAVEITMGETLVAWIDLKNTGKQTWTANTKLAPTPRDEASPLFAPSWLSATRITGPDADTPAGQVGRFSFVLGAAAAPGEYFQTFGLVEEGVTWFSQAPKGGGPPDDQLEVRIMVVAPEPPPPPPPPATTGGEGGSSGGSTDAAGSSGGVGEAGSGLESGPETGLETGGTGGESAPTTGGPGASSGAGSGDMSGGTSAGGWPGGAALPSGYGAEEGCGCRGAPERRGSGAALGLLALVGLLRGRRRGA